MVPHWFGTRDFVEVTSPCGTTVRVKEGKRRDPFSVLAFATQYPDKTRAYFHVRPLRRPNVMCVFHPSDTVGSFTDPHFVYLLLLRGTIVNRTCGIHKNLYISPFLPTIFGPINYGPP